MNSNDVLIRENVNKIQSKLNWKEMSNNPNISTEFIAKNIDFGWDFDLLSANPNVTEDLVERFPEKPWNWVVLYHINRFPIELVKKNIPSLDVLDAFIKGVNADLKIKTEFLECFKDYKWDWEKRSREATNADILMFPNLPWSSEALSRIEDLRCLRPAEFKFGDLTVEDILLFPDIKLPWGNELSDPDYFKFELLEMFPNKEWNYKELSKNKTISIHFIAAHVDKPWDWNEVSKNIAHLCGF